MWYMKKQHKAKMNKNQDEIDDDHISSHNISEKSNDILTKSTDIKTDFVLKILYQILQQNTNNLLMMSTLLAIAITTIDIASLVRNVESYDEMKQTLQDDIN